MAGNDDRPADVKEKADIWARLRKSGGQAAALAFLDQVLLSLTNFITLVLVASAMGASLFGSFAVGWMGILFSLSLQMAMVTAPTITHRPKVHRRRHHLYDRAALEHAVLLASVAALVMAPMLGLWAIAVEGRDFSAAEFATFFFAVFASGLHEHARRQAFVRDTPRQAIALDFGRSVLLIGALCASRYMQFPLTLTHAFLFIAMACATPLVFAFSSGIGRTTPRIRRHVALRHLPASFRLGVMTATEYVALNLPLLSLGLSSSSAALGQIRALTSISQIIQILPRSLETVLPHQLRAAIIEKRYEFTKFVTIATIAFGSILHIFLFVIFYFYSEIIVTSLFGNEFSPISYLLPVFVGSSFLSYVFSIQRSILIATNKPDIAMNARVYSLCASVIFSFTIVPFGEQVGTAIAVLLVEFAVVVACHQAFRLALGRS